WRGGTTVYTFDVPSRTWTAVPAADTNRANPGSVTTQGGVFGRFAYSPELNVYIYVDQVDDNVMLYRLTDAEAAAPPNPPTDLNVECSDHAAVRRWLDGSGSSASAEPFRRPTILPPAYSC